MVVTLVKYGDVTANVFSSPPSYMHGYAVTPESLIVDSLGILKQRMSHICRAHVKAGGIFCIIQCDIDIMLYICWWDRDIVIILSSQTNFSRP